MQVVDVDGIFELNARVTEEVDARSDAERFADISTHRLLNRAVVLHPVHPGSVPDWRIVHGPVSNRQVLIVVQFGAENEVSDTRERVCAAVAFRSGEQVPGGAELR